MSLHGHLCHMQCGLIPFLPSVGLFRERSLLTPNACKFWRIVLTNSKGARLELRKKSMHVFPKFRPPLGNSSMHRAFINGKALETLRHLSTQGMMPCCDAFGQCSMFGLSDSLIDFAMDFVCMSVFLPSWLRLCLFSVGLPMAFFTVHCPLFGVQCYSIAFFSIASLLYVGGIVSISFWMFNVCRRPGDVLTVAVDLPP